MEEIAALFGVSFAAVTQLIAVIGFLLLMVGLSLYYAFSRDSTGPILMAMGIIIILMAIIFAMISNGLMFWYVYQS